jgi:hypothetical protein
MWLDSSSGVKLGDRTKYNTAVLSDKMGIRMTGNGIANSLGRDIKRDIPDLAMPAELFGPPKNDIINDNNSQQNYMPMPQQQIIMQQPQQVANPFSQSQFSGVNLPDLPLNNPPSVIGQLINDDEVPEDIRSKYWFVFNKDNSLTFLDEERKRAKLLNMDIIKIDILNSVPYYDYTFDKELEFDVLRNVFETKLDRSLGYGNKTNPKNERILLQSQFTEQRHVNDDGANNQIREGFLKRLLGRR